MILPGDIFLKKSDLTSERFKDFLLKPAMILVFLNVFVHLFTFVTQSATHNLEADIQIIKNNSNLKLMNSMHLQSLDPIAKTSMAARIEADPYLFIKDTWFWVKAQDMSFVGDQVQVEKNKMVLRNLASAFENSTQQIYGLSNDSESFMNWITYQFTHANTFHLFSNIIFLFLIVTLLQSFVSSHWLAAVYVITGLVSGASYLLFYDELSLPLIGASGSVSGLMAFLAVVKAHRNIKWSYFVTPLPSGYGNIFLPAYLIFPIYLLSDFTSVLTDTDGVSGAVAHSAHIGGALAGFALGLVYLYCQRISLKFSTF